MLSQIWILVLANFLILSSCQNKPWAYKQNSSQPSVLKKGNMDDYLLVVTCLYRSHPELGVPLLQKKTQKKGSNIHTMLCAVWTMGTDFPAWLSLCCSSSTSSSTSCLLFSLQFYGFIKSVLFIILLFIFTHCIWLMVISMNECYVL